MGGVKDPHLRCDRSEWARRIANTLKNAANVMGYMGLMGQVASTSGAAVIRRFPRAYSLLPAPYSLVHAGQ